ncbi:efflux RND transporter periplasmic adaptor subunit [Desulforhabdus sp. TSK]|uniref:efflux RND transporter periplasmic adaptor subunit n=1 Tax=Desulforhabdus sp. TSK TaxID=2925014 RepID=UPI001FC8DFD5|nr:efflux RND transporter periplasmic adaptor subunit [Desulforhabdus sp. TSK]
MHPTVSSFACRRPMPFRHALCLFAILSLALAPLLWGCSKAASGDARGKDAGKSPVVPVLAGTAVEKTVPVELRAIGNVQPYATVAIKAQVTGELVSVQFKEGQEVKKGDLLFTIDPRPFEAKLRQAEANLARDRAQLQNARKQAERYSSVAQKGYVSAEQFDQITANAAALEASVKAGEAAVESARLELKYCSIRSPLDGVAGVVKIDQGNIVKASDKDNVLVVINQVRPIYVSFSVPEQNLFSLRKYMASQKLEVTATVPGGEDRPPRGELTFLDNTVDPATGTIQLKATFANTEKLLWPGQFVNVLLRLTTLEGAVVIPGEAVQTGQEGPYVYVVKPDFTVEYRKVVLGRPVDNEIVILQGLAPGEKVVTDGQLRLAPGTQVKILDPQAGESGGKGS